MFQAMRKGRAPTQVAPPRGCIRAGPKSGSRPRRRDLLAQALVLAAAHVGQLDPLGHGRGSRVEIDGELEARRDPPPEVAGEPDARLQRGRAERHERHDVDRADPRVLAGLLLHVDLAQGNAATSRSSASATGPCSPASVKTLRLWEGSLVRSRR